MLRQHMVSLSQCFPVDLATNWLNEHWPVPSFTDVRVLSISVPYWPNVLSRVSHVVLIITCTPPLVGWKADQVARIVKSAMVQGVQNLLCVDLRSQRLPQRTDNPSASRQRSSLCFWVLTWPLSKHVAIHETFLYQSLSSRSRPRILGSCQDFM